MPTYQYLCNECGHRFEQFQSIKSKPLRKCPNCGKLQLNRLIGAGGGLIFKGSGFYQTDYRSDNYKSAAKSAKPASEKTDTKAPSKTPESTPAKAESAPKTATSD